MAASVAQEPYLFFAGDCRDAMDLYRSVFGGDLQVQTWEEAPGETPEQMQGKVMHARLEGGDVTLMGADSPTPDALGTGKVSLSLMGTDDRRLRSIFDGLAQDGEVTSPLETQFWGDTFGTVRDRFGVDWMVNISAEERAAGAAG